MHSVSPKNINHDQNHTLINWRTDLQFDKTTTVCSVHGKNCIIDNRIAIHNVVYIYKAPESNNSYVITTTTKFEDITCLYQVRAIAVSQFSGC